MNDWTFDPWFEPGEDYVKNGGLVIWCLNGRDHPHPIGRVLWVRDGHPSAPCWLIGLDFAVSPDEMRLLADAVDALGLPEVVAAW